VDKTRGKGSIYIRGVGVVIDRNKYLKFGGGGRVTPVSDVLLFITTDKERSVELRGRYEKGDNLTVRDSQ
jgi:hypothetical protein